MFHLIMLLPTLASYPMMTIYAETRLHTVWYFISSSSFSYFFFLLLPLLLRGQDPWRAPHDHSQEKIYELINSEPSWGPKK